MIERDHPTPSIYYSIDKSYNMYSWLKQNHEMEHISLGNLGRYKTYLFCYQALNGINETEMRSLKEMIGWDLLEAAGARSKYNNENEKVLIQDIFNTAFI